MCAFQQGARVRQENRSLHLGYPPGPGEPRAREADYHGGPWRFSGDGPCRFARGVSPCVQQGETDQPVYALLYRHGSHLCEYCQHYYSSFLIIFFSHFNIQKCRSWHVTGGTSTFLRENTRLERKEPPRCLQMVHRVDLCGGSGAVRDLPRFPRSRNHSYAGRALQKNCLLGLERGRTSCIASVRFHDRYCPSEQVIFHFFLIILFSFKYRKRRHSPLSSG